MSTDNHATQEGRQSVPFTLIAGTLERLDVFPPEDRAQLFRAIGRRYCLNCGREWRFCPGTSEGCGGKPANPWTYLPVMVALLLVFVVGMAVLVAGAAP